MSTKRAVEEIAVCEVEVNGQWLEYAHTERKTGETWKMLRLAEVKPQVRVRYISPEKYQKDLEK